MQETGLLAYDNVAIAAVCSVLPSGTVSLLEDELAYYDGVPARAKQVAAISGLETRRVADEGVTASDLCAQAAATLLRECDIASDSIDALFFVSQTPDYILPASAAILQHRLGLSSSCSAMDLNCGCAGYVNALWTGAALIASGACSRVLLLVGDTQARFLNRANRALAPVFGDAGTATLLERREGTAPMSFLMGNDGSGSESLMVPGGGSRIPHRADEGPDSPFNAPVIDHNGNPWRLGGYGQLWMDGMAVFTFGVTVIPPHLKRHLALAGVEASRLERLALHQANKLMVENIARKTGVSADKAPWDSLKRHGNLGAASIPVLLCDTPAAPAGAPDSAAAEAASGPSMLCGFGAGLSWGSCICSLRDTHLLDIRDYVPTNDVPGREERIDYWHRRFQGRG